MQNFEFNNSLYAKKNTFYLICVEVILQFIILFYSNNTTITKYLLLVLLCLSFILCIIEIKKVNAINLFLSILIGLLMIISTLLGSGGWGAFVNYAIFIINFIVLSKMKFSYKQICLVSKIYVLFFIILMFFSKRVYTIYINTNVFNYSLNPNTVAYLTLLNAFFLFQLIKKRYSKIKLLLIISITFYLLLETGSRTSLFAFIIFLIMYLLYKNKKYIINKTINRKYKFWIGFIIAMSFVVIFIYSRLLPYLFPSKEIIILKKNLFSGRQLIWEEILNLIKFNWVFGVGADYAFGGQFYSAHNFFLGYASIFGLPVMVGIVILLYRVLKDSFIRNKNENTNFLFCIWVSLLFVSMFETVLSYSLVLVFSTTLFTFNCCNEYRRDYV